MPSLISRLLFVSLLITAGSLLADPVPTYTADSGTLTYTGGPYSNFDRDSWTFSGPGFTSSGGGNTPNPGDLGYTLETMGRAFSVNSQIFFSYADYAWEQGSSTVQGQSYYALYTGSGSLTTGPIVIPDQPVTPGEQLTVSVPATVVGGYAVCAPFLVCDGGGYLNESPANIVFAANIDLSGTLTLTYQPDFDFSDDQQLDLVSATFVSSPEPAPLSILLFASAIMTASYWICKGHPFNKAVRSNLDRSNI